MGKIGFVKRIRGVIKQFLPYGMERRYILKTYGMTEPWDPVLNDGLGCFIRDLLPYGLVRGHLKCRYEQEGGMSLPRLTRWKMQGLKVFRTLHLLGERRYCLLRDYLIVEGSGFFDEKWYRTKYLGAQAEQIDCIWHYCTTGWRKAFRPSQTMDDQFFQKCYPVSWGRTSQKECALPESRLQSRISTVDKAKEPTFPKGAHAVIKEFRLSRRQFGRVAIFAAFSRDGTIPETTLYYLKGLRDVVDNIIFVADNPILPGEVDKLAGLVAFCQCERHGEYDFGSYRRGWSYLTCNRRLRNVDEVVFCNDSCYGPVVRFGEMFEVMEEKDKDIWGVCDNTEIQWHIQSYFWVFKRRVLESKAFIDFMRSVAREECIGDIVRKYEVPFTKRMKDAGFSCASFISSCDLLSEEDRRVCENPVHWPIAQLKSGCPIVKVKAFRQIKSNLEGIGKLHESIAALNPELEALIQKREQVPDLRGISFSLIMPTYNRAYCIKQSIDAVLRQTYGEFELIIVDDGSSDGTEALVKADYAEELASGRLRYLKKENGGVCKARNVGLAATKNSWIGYVDSDNQIMPNFLEAYAMAISQNPDVKCYYARFKMQQSGQIIGKPFSFQALLSGNYIDLGTFVHHRSVYEELGGFDERMTRLVDWDLIIRYTEKFAPFYLDQIVLLYDDSQKADRISVNANYAVNLNLLRSKRQNSFIVTTVITAYNHREFIETAIRSALKQKGDFVHEILVSDDGSTDGTREIVKEMVRRAPTKIRDISSDENIGVSANLRKCFAAASGKYVAILEGDDYWLWDSKLARQVEFMEKNPDCTMVFSRLNILNQVTGKMSFLPRQNGLSEKLTGEDFIRDPNQNLIANFSSCMFRAKIAKEFPELLYATRFTEISCAFYIERLGPMGFINLPMSVYRLHPNGIWSAGDKKKKLVSAIKTREVALQVCAPQYRERMQAIIDRLRAQLRDLEDTEGK